VRGQLHAPVGFPPGTCSVVVKALCYRPEGRGFETDEANEFFSIYLILPGVYSACKRNEYQMQKLMFLGSRVRPVRKARNLTAICDPTV
jgi:hypothetical protein